jgi:hypothetical protein
MKFIIGKLGVLALVGILFLSGCSKGAEGETLNGDLTQPVTFVGETTDDETTVDPAAGTSPKLDDETAKAMQLERMIEGIKTIILKDIEGNVVERTFSKEEMLAIETAFNESFIMDTAYIEMITGYTMTISLENGEDVFITSYGDPVFIVARIGDGETYHLGCEVIATILLEGMN